MTIETPYIFKIFRAPNFICKDGVCDLDLVFKTIDDHLIPRCGRLLGCGERDGEEKRNQDTGSGIEVPVSITELPPTPSATPPLPTTASTTSISSVSSVSSITSTATTLPTLPTLPSSPPPTPIPTPASTPPPLTILPLISDLWNSSEPLNYHCQLSIGSPPLPFFLDLDTGSSLLWLQSHLSSSDPPIANQQIYNPTFSSSSNPSPKNRWTQVHYGDGTSLTATMYYDTVSLGGLRAEGFLFGAVPTSGLRSEFLGGKSNGILGLAPADGKGNLVGVLKRQGRIRRAWLALIGCREDPKLMMGKDMGRLLQPRGRLVVGDLRRDMYRGDIAWCPVVKMGGVERWLVKMGEVRINGKTVFRDQLALVDTGTAYIAVSGKVFEGVKDAIPGARDLEDRRGMFSFPEEELEGIGFCFGGREMKMMKQDFGLGGTKEEGRMVSSIISVPPREDRDDFFAGEMENVWIIGGIFLDNVVTVFDFDLKRVGFAEVA
ncbi:aspartic peptidase domain-containing protein [Pyronema omphalodes]|nr:aspartic peptidase domain-containing protein [Pyronema omphalodes]